MKNYKITLFDSMIKKQKRKKFIFGFLILFNVFLLSYQEVKADASTEFLTYNGRILRPDGKPLLSTDVSFKLQIRSLAPSSCILFEDVQASVDLSTTGGVFNLKIKSIADSRTDTSGLSLAEVFSNISNKTLASGDAVRCGSSNVTTLPTVGEARQLFVYFRDNSDSSFGGNYDGLPAQDLQYVPMALQAKQIGGYTQDRLIRLAEGVSTTDTELDSTKWTEFLALLGGTSAQYLKSSDALNGGKLSSGSVKAASIDSVPYSKVTDVPATLTQMAGATCSNGDMFKKVGGTWTCEAAGTSTLSGDVTGTIGAATVEKIRGSSVAAPSGATDDKKVLRFINGAPATWELQHLKLSDLKNETGTGSAIDFSNCGMGKTVTWNMTSDKYECSNIQILSAQVTGLKNWASADPGAGLEVVADVLQVKVNDLKSGILADSILTGVPVAPTAATDTNTTQVATTAFVMGQTSTKANIESPTFTGTPSGATAAVNTNTTQLATTAFVLGQASSANPAVNGSVAVGTSTKFSREDHVHPTDTTRAPTASPTFTGNVTTSGQIYSPLPANITTNAIDWNLGNVQTSSYNCASAFTMTNMIDGVTYTLVVTEGSTTLCQFGTVNGSALAGGYKYKPANGNRTGSTYTVYNLMKVGTLVLVTWVTGF